MTCWPTRFDNQVWPMPRAPVAIGIATMPATSAVNSEVFLSGIAVSSTARSRNGEMIPSPAETRIRTRSAESWRLYGLKRRATRPTGCGPVAPSGRPGSASASRLKVPPLGNRGRRRSRLQCQVENFANRHDWMEVHLIADIFGEVVQVGPVALGQDHVREPCGVRRQHLLLEATDRQHTALQRDLAGHA